MASAFSKKLKNLDDDDDMEDFLSNILNDSGKKDKSKATNSSSVSNLNQVDQPISRKLEPPKINDDDEFDGIFDGRAKSATTDLTGINLSARNDTTPARPPTRSGSRTVTVQEKEIAEDSMDDIFSSMGLDSPKRGGVKNIPSTNQGQPKGRSLMSGGGPSSSTNKKTLDSLLSFDDIGDGLRSGARRDNKDEFSFGGYTPSSAGKQPANRRLVRFKSNEKSFDDGDDDDGNNELLSTAPASLTSYNKEPDWLTDLGVGGETDRPKSVGSAVKDNSFDLDDMLGDLSKKRLDGNSRRNSTDSKKLSRKPSVVNVLKLDDHGDDDDDDDDGTSKPHVSTSQNTPKKSSFNLDFLKGFGGDNDDDDDGQTKTQITKSTGKKSTIKVDQSELDLLTNQIKLLEADKSYLLEKIERMKLQHEEEKRFIEDAFSKRVLLAEETFEKCHERLKQENEILSADILEKVRILEREKSDLFGSHLKRMKEMEVERNEEMERMRNDYRSSIETMRQEHEASLQRILKTKNQELEVVISSRDHVKKLETALTHLEVNTADLNDLRHKVKSKADESEVDQQLAMRLKESSMKAMQERMTEREKEMEDEKSRMLDLISKLEKQLTNQNAQIEKEKYELRQEEMKLKNERIHLESERSEFIETSQRERMELERLKGKLRSEQANMTSELRREKARLAEEKAHFEVEMKLKVEEHEKLMSNKYQSEVEASSMKRALTEKMNDLERRSREVKDAELKLEEEKGVLQERKESVEKEKHALDKMAHQLNKSSKELIQKFEELEEQRDHYKSLMKEALSGNKTPFHKSSLEPIEERIYQEDEIPVKEVSNQSYNSTNNASHANGFDVVTLFTPDERRLYETYTTGRESMNNNSVNDPSRHKSLNSSRYKSLNSSHKDFKQHQSLFLKDMNYLEREKYFVHAVKNMSRIFS